MILFKYSIVALGLYCFYSEECLLWLCSICVLAIALFLLRSLVQKKAKSHFDYKATLAIRQLSVGTCAVHLCRVITTRNNRIFHF